jgi:hypothetical protein
MQIKRTKMKRYTATYELNGDTCVIDVTARNKTKGRKLVRMAHNLDDSVIIKLDKI